MFDISFSELVIIGLVALIVIGPEQLPKVARTAGALMGRLQRFMGQVKEEIQREARFEELQKLQQEVNNKANTLHSELSDLRDEVILSTSESAVENNSDHPTSVSTIPRQKTTARKRASQEDSPKPKRVSRRKAPATESSVTESSAHHE